MGVLTDIFIANTTEAKQLDARRSPLSTCIGADIKSIGLVEIACLQCILNGEDPHDLEHVTGIVEAYSLVQEFSTDGPWIYQVPEVLTDALVKVNAADIDRIRTEWYMTEEMRGWEGTSSQYRSPDPFQTLTSLAIQAKRAGKSLFLWCCL